MRSVSWKPLLLPPPVKIFATDISDYSVEKARKGFFKNTEVAGLSKVRLSLFFTKQKEGYEINKEIRDLCVFGKHDLILEPPFSNMDLVSCRNLLIYLNPNARDKIIPLLHHSLRSNGFLLLGRSETIGPFPRLFQQVDRKYKLYMRKAAVRKGAVAIVDEEPNGFSISAGVKKRLEGRIDEGLLRKELEEIKETIDVTIARFEETNEELQATNEELNAGNEELQSTNEELETAKEELQSTNEELMTLNEEVQNRNLELHLARQFADSIVETIQTPLLILNSHLKVIRANAVFYEAFKLTAPETENKYIYNLSHGQWNIPSLRTLLEKIIPNKKEIFNFEIDHNFPIVGHKTLLINAREIYRSEGSVPMILVSIDLLTIENRVTKKIMEYSEGEKQRVGKDLHDGLGQSMTGIALLSKSLEKKLVGKGMSEVKDAAKITQLVTQGIFEIKRMARGLTPIPLEGIGLIPALSEAAEKVKSLFGVKCLFECKEKTITSNPLVKVNLYYIVREAINNAIRHGKAKQIVVRLERRAMKGGKVIFLSISDDGFGLPKNFADKDGMGLRIMKYRASDIGGSLEVSHRAKGGTVITALIPPPQSL